jgi:uncharacterized protein
MKQGNMRSTQLSAETVGRTLANFMQTRSEIILGYLFGSLVNRKIGPVHDIDIALLISADRLKALDQSEPYGLRARLIVGIAGILGTDKIDLVLLNQASPVLLRQVVAKGRLIYCISEQERIRFETSALKRYADTAQLRNIKRFYRRKRIGKGVSGYD